MLRFVTALSLIFILSGKNTNAGYYHVDTYGAVANDGIDDAPAFRAAVAAAKAAGGTNTIQFGTGNYHLSPATGDDEIVLFDDIDNLTVKGLGAQNTRLILQDRLVKGLVFDGCDNLLVQDFSLTHNPLPGTQGTITWVNNDGTQFDLDIDSDYPLLSDSFFTAEPRLNFGQIIDVINGQPYYHGTLRTENYGSYSWSFQSNRVYRVTLDSTQGGFPDMELGDRFIFFNSGPWTEPLNIRNAENVDLRYVSVFSSPNRSVILKRIENLAVKGFNAKLDPQVSGRLFAGNRDGMPIGACRGAVVIEDCFFQGIGDDAININGEGAVIWTVLADNQADIRGTARDNIRIGDQLQIYDPSTASLIGSPIVTDITNTYYFTFDRDIAGMTTNQSVYNISAVGAGAVFRNNTFGQFRGRVIIGSHDILLENNTFRSTSGPMLRVPQTAGGPTSSETKCVPFNITIRSNDFIRTQGTDFFIEATQASPEGVDGDRSMQGIVIENNYFEDDSFAGGHGLFWFESCKDIFMNNNLVDVTALSSYKMIHGYNYENINIEDLYVIGDSNLDYVFTSNEDDALMLRVSEGNLDSSSEYARSKTSLKGRWLFDETSGSTVSNTAYDLAINNAGLYGDSTRVSGHSDTAVHLDGTNDYVAIEDLVFDRDDYEEFTAAAWIKTSNLGYQTILSYDNNQYFALTTKNNTQAGKLGCGFMPQAGTGIVSCFSSTVVADGNWHHAAAVFDHGEIRLYVDGVCETITDTDGDPDFGTGTNRYGFIGDGSLASAYNGTRGNSDFSGDIDEVHLFMKALTDDQIQRLYEFGSVNYSELLFLDTFTNSAGALAGTLPDITPAGETWTGGWTCDGSSAVLNRDGDGGYRNAFLDFIPESGAIYEFSVDYDITSVPSTDAGFGIGFATLESTTAGIFTIDAASMRVLENGTGQIGMADGTVGNLQELSTLGTNGTLTVVLDTTPANWTVEWKYNQGIITSGTFYSNPGITNLVIHGGDANITADNLKLKISIP